MKKDKYEELKPEVFKYQKNDEDFTPGLFVGAILCVISATVVLGFALLVLLEISKG